MRSPRSLPVARAFGHVWRRRRQYRGLRDLFLRFYNGWLNRVRWWPSRLRRAVIPIRLKCSPAPFLVRQGTRDWIALDEIYFNGEYAPARQHLGPDTRWVLDLGANVGFSVRYWLDSFAAARVVAVELDEGNLSLCHRNVEASGQGHRVTAVRGAVFGQKREMAMDLSGGSTSYHLTGDGRGDAADGRASTPGSTITTVTVPEVLASAGVDGPIDLVKCDIEGAEESVFAACGPWIDRVRLLFVELHGDYGRERLLADLCTAGVSRPEVLYEQHKKGGQRSVMMLRLR